MCSVTWSVSLHALGTAHIVFPAACKDGGLTGGPVCFQALQRPVRGRGGGSSLLNHSEFSAWCSGAVPGPGVTVSEQAAVVINIDGLVSLLPYQQ